MKSSELVRLLKKNGWFVVRQTGSHMIMEHAIKKGQIVCPYQGSHMIMEHAIKKGQIVCPYHGSHEVGKGLEKKIKKDAGIK